MTGVPFMSPQHVDVMNRLLEASEDVRAACAQLPEPVAMVQRLSDGPDGQPVAYALTFGPTVRFSLEDVAKPDIVVVGDWRQMIRAARAKQEGRVEDPGLTVQHGHAALERIGPLFALAGSVATVPVELPDV